MRTAGKSEVSWDVTDSVVSESKYEVRSLWRKRSMAWESSKAEVAIFGKVGGERVRRMKKKKNRKGQAVECGCG